MDLTTDTPATGRIADPMRPVPFRVRRNRRETHDTFTLELEPPDGAFSFEPGQFNMLYQFGVGESAISISGDPQQRATLVHTIRAVGSVTRAMQRVKAGAYVGVRGPFGVGWPIAAARGSDVVLVAGGIGLAPIRPVLYSLLEDRKRYGAIVLLYGARTAADLLYRKELERLRSHLDLQIEVTVDSGRGDWRGNVGVVTSLLNRVRYDPVHTVAMMCGPEIMMRFTAIELEKTGVPAENIYYSMERSMKCAVAHCGHCQFGPSFVCKDGPVFASTTIRNWLGKREI